MATAISFFAGAGGLDTGIQLAGFDIRLTVEIEETYCETLRNNHPNANIIKGDIMDYDKSKILKQANLTSSDEIDLLFGGSPCQSFSTAGKRQAFSDPRGQAMIKFAELVREVRPKVFLLENVKGLLSAALKHRPLNQRGKDAPPLEPDELRGSALTFLLDQFKDYKVEYKLINSADYGVPQTRERVFFVGVRNDLDCKYIFPTKTHHEKGMEGKKRWVTFGELLENMDVINHHYVEYSLDRLEYMKMIPKGGGNWRDLPKDIVKKAMGGAYESGGGKVGFFRRIHLNKPAPTMLTSPIQKSTNLGHPLEDRPLSIEEYLAVQQFPIDYKVAGSLSKQYVQVGNAVPVGLAKILGQSIYKLLNEIYEKQKIDKVMNEVALSSASN
ncbi:DNA cytosine methyltransferase [Brevibacillus dissolubilis]|uniref:DNA cytosine methyltransferase n=1 Tax=Brevibacillus dissolubilis TaxID=1844116 RepID=UPI0011178A30|nr:DNA cytosine methyltransferase [Brevibacillus dissolubilis]